MPRDFFDPTPEQQNVVSHQCRSTRAERLIDSCEYCNPDGAEIPFDWVLDRVFEQPAKCPNCRHDILEKTLIEPE